jgi:hypothetical protein
MAEAVACSVSAVLMVRNGAPTLGKLLDHMGANQIPVIVIDHGSTDATRAIAAARLGRGVSRIVDEPFQGSFDLTRQLELKAEIIGGLEADWIIHLDADEFLFSPVPGESLRGLIERHAATAAEAIGCDEYVFLPLAEDEEHDSETFMETMTAYVHLENKDPKQRVFRRRAALDRWMKTGGHFVSPNAVGETLVLQHYMGLSLDHLRAQYVGRVYTKADLGKLWNFDRRATGAGFVVAPDPNLVRHRQGGQPLRAPGTRHLPVFLRRSYVPRTLAAVPPDADILLACEMASHLSWLIPELGRIMPALRVFPILQPAEELPDTMPLLQVVADGRRWLAADHSRPRELATRWAHFVATIRQEALRVGCYAEVRLEDLEDGRISLDTIIEGLLAPGAPATIAFPVHAPVVPPPWPLPGDALERFEAVARPLLLDLGYAVASGRSQPQ